MTRTRFTIAVILQSFGVLRKNKRLTDAAFELQLMQDGEELLGAFCWPKIEEIEELSMEYWNLRRMEREEKGLIDKLNEAEETLRRAQESRAKLIDQSKDIGQEFIQKREDLFDVIESLNTERDEIMTEATAIKRKHSALKMKSEVLREEGKVDKEKLDQCRVDLRDLKEQFADSKKKLSSLDTEIEIEEERLAQLQKKIEKKMAGSKGATTESFSFISRANRDITDYRAELGVLNEAQSLVFREIGRFLNLNAKREDCRKATKGHRGLSEQTRLLYQSIQWNRNLVARTSH